MAHTTTHIHAASHGCDGAEVIANTPEEFRSQIKADMAKWANVVKDNGIAAK